MTIEDIDGSLYLFDPTDDKKIQELIDSYPEFREDLGDLDKIRINIIRYIILFYDMNTELKDLYTDFWKRRGIAAKLAGFKRKNKKFDESVKDLILGYNDKVNAMIIRYLLCFSNPDYIDLMNTWDIYMKQSMQAMRIDDQTSAEKIKVINVNLTTLNKKIKEKTELVFGGKENRKLEELLYYHLEKERIEYSPESVVRTEDMKDLFDDFDPYKMFVGE
jgi:hypothetical protein